MQITRLSPADFLAANPLRALGVAAEIVLIRRIVYTPSANAAFGTTGCLLYRPRPMVAPWSMRMADGPGLAGPAARTIARVAVAGVVGYLTGAALRYGLIEREDLGLACQSIGAPWWCDLRLLVIRAFLNQVFGLTSVALAVVAAWRRSALAATLAVVIGTFGMVLYGFTWSGIGVLGGALILARLHGQWQQDR